MGALQEASVVGLKYGFQGRSLDAETGLVYFRARYYDPNTGRFVQRDPVWDAGSVGNLYSFVGNGPLSRCDPFGTDEVSEPGVLQGFLDGLASKGAEIMDMINDLKGLIDKLTKCGLNLTQDQFKDLLKSVLMMALSKFPPFAMAMAVGEFAGALAWAWYSDNPAYTFGKEMGSRLADLLLNQVGGKALKNVLGALGGSLKKAGGKSRGSDDSPDGPSPSRDPVSNSNRSDAHETQNENALKNCFTGETLVATPNGFEAIEHVDVGERVIAQEPVTPQPEQEIDPDAWVVFKLTLFTPEDPRANVSIEALRPKTWLAGRRDPVTGLVRLGTNELSGTWARLDGIEPCPQLEDGPGRLVLTTFVHNHAGLLRLWFEECAEPLVSTETHTFWNETHKKWLPIGKFVLGESVLTRFGPRRLVAVEQVRGRATVFNIEVQGLHNYLVTRDQVLVHNNNGKGESDDERRAREDFERHNAEDADPADMEYYGGAGDGVIYRVPGSGTPSGKPYIGSADDMADRTRSGRDDRDRTQAEIIDHYPIGDVKTRKEREQAGIDREGGLEATDNLRNEIAEDKRND